MSKPTPQQRKVLSALQNQAASLHTMLTRQADHGGTPSTAWQRSYDNRASQHHALATAALAGGLPMEWIDHVRERGQKAMRWRAGAFLRPAEPVDRDALLHRLDGEACVLAVGIGVHAHYRHRDTVRAASEMGTTHAVERNLRLAAQRIALVAGLLQLDPAEAEKLWTGTRLLDIAATATADLSVTDLRERWRDMANTDINLVRREATALADAGITPVTNFPDAEQLADLVVDYALRHRNLGAAIDDAIAAALPPNFATLEHQPEQTVLPQIRQHDLDMSTGL
ncbi:hypothetical protein ACWEVD_01530 [Nocardia thailandica]